MHSPIDERPTQLHETLIELRNDILKLSRQILSQYSSTPFELDNHPSALNLAHYLALRRHDIRTLQMALIEAGASSLGHCEAHVMATITQLLKLLKSDHIPRQDQENTLDHPSHAQGNQLLQQNSERLFGPISSDCNSHIMVTLPTKAAWDYQLIYKLINSGMTCARIDCTHDDKDMWKGMVNNVIKARSGLNQNCTILMDLAGQRVRTQLGHDANRQIKLKPRHLAHHVEPAQLLLTHEDDQVYPSMTEEFQAYLGLPDSLFQSLISGDILAFHDGNGKKRKIIISARSQCGNWIAQCHDKTLLTPDIRYKWRRKLVVGKQNMGDFTAAYFPEEQAEIFLHYDDPLFLSNQDIKQCQSRYDDENNLIQQIGCSHPEIVNDLKKGDWIWFDEGKIGAVVNKVEADGAILVIRQIHPDGCKLRTDKSINFPDTAITLPALSEKDLQDLDFVTKHADMIGFSFVQSREDMQQLMSELIKRDAKHIAIIAKIETKTAVHNLPEIILSAIKEFRLGIMIARGNLAIELGGERMAEIQEELLWLCEAAHIPAIWATQVLENLTKNGIATRAELTDAAMASRAECIMLNKGAYILRAVRTLNDIIYRMKDHQYKKGARMRALSW